MSVYELTANIKIESTMHCNIETLTQCLMHNVTCRSNYIQMIQSIGIHTFHTFHEHQICIAVTLAAYPQQHCYSSLTTEWEIKLFCCFHSRIRHSMCVYISFECVDYYQTAYAQHTAHTNDFYCPMADWVRIRHTQWTQNPTENKILSILSADDIYWELRTTWWAFDYIVLRQLWLIAGP